MAISVLHAKVQTIPDDPDSVLAGEVVPSDWNDEHVLTCATGKVLGRTSSGTGPVEEISISSLSSGRTKLTANTTFTLGSGGDFATMQEAWDTLVRDYDLNGYKATVEFLPGTYEGLDTIHGANALVGGYVIFDGLDRADVSIVPLTTGLATGYCLWAGNPGPSCEIRNVTFDCSGGGSPAYLQNPGVCWNIYDFDIILDGTFYLGAWVEIGATLILAPKDFTSTTINVSGGGFSAFYAAADGNIYMYAGTLTIDGAYDATIYVDPGANVIFIFNAFAGTATGPRKYVNKMGTLWNLTGYEIPGDSAGTDVSGFGYVT